MGNTFTKTIAKPIAEPTVEPIAEPTVEPIAEPTTEPITEIKNSDYDYDYYAEMEAESNRVDDTYSFATHGTPKERAEACRKYNSLLKTGIY